MPPDLKEQLALQDSFLRDSRRESPALEAAAAKAIEEGFRDLIETRYLYQKVTVDLSLIDETVRPIIARPPPTPGKNAPAAVEVVVWKQKLPEYIKGLFAEVEKRPWLLTTRDRGENSRISQIQHHASIGGQSLGTATDQLPLPFYLPPVQMKCGGPCKRHTVFSAHVSSSGMFAERVYPKTGEKGTEQVFQPVYRCEICRSMVYTMLVHRVGLRLHLCGFAPRREPFASRTLPAPLAPILSDAEQAVAEGDTFAGFYHLRTLLEHYLKLRLGIPFSEQIRGEELIERHYAKLPVPLRSVVPSLSEAFTGLSERLHARTGKREDFTPLRDKICDHIDVLATLERQSPPT